MSKSIKVELHGMEPLLMNSNASVNPLNPLVRELKTLTSKRKRTEEDDRDILLLKWRLSMYYDEKLGPYIPSVNLLATLREAAKKHKRGKDIISSAVVSPSDIPLHYNGPRNIDELAALADGKQQFIDVRVGRIKQASVMISRARFNPPWHIKCEIVYDDLVFNKDDIMLFLTIGGEKIGLCDYRPRYGRFTVKEV
ncbi:MAG: hypothetical protein WC261_14035 [Synergistaceae bacterium]|jgi:hypothetical protein